MGNIGLLKRGLPFFATFALGIFVASFFVNIGGSRMGYHDRGRCHRDMWEMRVENEQLRDENQQLREQLDDARHDDGFRVLGPPPTTLDSPDVSQPVPLPPPASAVKPHKVHVK